MKIFISADIEGVAGITSFTQIFAGAPDYAAGCALLTAEVNAAIEGALAAGASEIVVADSHSQMTTILPDRLHPEAKLIRGVSRPHYMMQGLDGSFDAAFLVGYHARAGTPDGVLGHTFIADISEVRLNDAPVGEAAFNAAFAGHYGVPVALITGDDALRRETQPVLPWAEKAVTKWGISGLAAVNLSPQKAQEAIRAAAMRALHQRADMRPLILTKPIRLELDFGAPAIAPTLAADIPGVETDLWKTVTYTAVDMPDAVRVLRLIQNLTSGFTRRPSVSWMV